MACAIAPDPVITGTCSAIFTKGRRSLSAQPRHPHWCPSASRGHWQIRTVPLLPTRDLPLRHLAHLTVGDRSDGGVAPIGANFSASTLETRTSTGLPGR